MRLKRAYSPKEVLAMKIPRSGWPPLAGRRGAGCG